MAGKQRPEAAIVDELLRIRPRLSDAEFHRQLAHRIALLRDPDAVAPRAPERTSPQRKPSADPDPQIREPHPIEQALEQQLGARGVRVEIARRPPGWALKRDGVFLATVTARHAVFPGQPVIAGDFSAAGDHWDQLAAALAPAPPRAKRHTAFPAGFDATLHALALEASRRLREERSLVFAHTVELIHGAGEISFEPLQVQPVLAVPFRWSADGRTQPGRLLLNGSGDPLPLVAAGTDPELLALAWATALLGYAELTCPEVVLAQPSGRPGAAARRAAEPRAHRRASRPQVAAARPKLEWDNLRPTPASSAAIASYVAGHRRRLPPPRTAGSEARAHAARVGITLGRHETWVRPHARGLPATAVVQLYWSEPSALGRSPGHAR